MKLAKVSRDELALIIQRRALEIAAGEGHNADIPLPAVEVLQDPIGTSEVHWRSAIVRIIAVSRSSGTPRQSFQPSTMSTPTIDIHCCRRGYLRGGPNAASPCP